MPCGESDNIQLTHIFYKHLLVLYTALTESAVRDIFQRVQLGVALTPAGMLIDLHSRYLMILNIFIRAATGDIYTVLRVRPFGARVNNVTEMHTRWVGDLVQKFLRVDGGISDFIVWDTKRSRDFSNLAYAMFCCDVIQTRPMLAAPKLENWLNRQDPPREQLKNEMQNLLKNLCQIVSDKQYNSAFSKVSERVAPVEFVFICESVSL